MPHLTKLFVTFLVIVALSGCGGGDNSGPPPLDITAASPPAGTTGVAYAGYMFAASGGTPPLSWSESGSLPPGLQLGTSGKLSGNPATAGMYPITLTVNDSSMPPVKTSVSVSLTVNDSAITVAPASPPEGVVSDAYPGFTFSANGGSPPYAWSATGTLPPGLALGADGSLSGTPTQTGTFAFSVIPTDSAQTPVKGPTLAVQVVINNPPPTMSLGTPRSRHTATRLMDGSVLVAGGATGGSLRSAVPTATAERYDPAAEAFIPTGLMTSAREAHTATLLTQGQRAGQVLITGGFVAGTSVQTAELYNPATGQFTATGNMVSARAQHTATLLPSGKVLIAGGSGVLGSSAELYDPASGTFAATENMTAPHSGHAAALLASDKVLIAGGSSTAAEIYDPATGAFEPTGAMLQSRVSLTATTLTSGQVLITGGFDSTGVPLSSAEVYDPAAGAFTAIGAMAAARAQHTAVLRADGTVLILGGSNHIHLNDTMCRFAGCPLRVLEPTASVEVYDPATRLFTTTAALSTGRDSHTATLLADGGVLVAGGDVVRLGVYGGSTRCCIYYDYLGVTARGELK
jgi:hypothetical protein